MKEYMEEITKSHLSNLLYLHHLQSLPLSCMNLQSNLIILKKFSHLNHLSYLLNKCPSKFLLISNSIMEINNQVSTALVITFNQQLANLSWLSNTNSSNPMFSKLVSQYSQTTNTQELLLPSSNLKLKFTMSI